MVKNAAAVTVAVCGVLAATACGSSTTTAAGGTPAAGGSAPATSGGSPSAPSPGGPPSNTAPASSSAPAASACGGATPVEGSVVHVTYNDNGKNLCVHLGTTLDVLLQGTAASKWEALHASSELILASKPNPAFMLTVGSAGGSFEAIRTGTAYVSASRYPCGTASPGSRNDMQCGVIIGYRLNVTVAS